MRILAVFAWLACWTAAGPAFAEPLTIRIAFSQVGTEGRQYASLQTSAIAHARGFVEQEFKDDPEVKVQWIFFRGAGPATNEAAANGQIDFFSQGDLPSIVGRSVGLRTKLLLNVAARQNRYLAVPVRSGLQSIMELRGKKIAQHLGTNITLSIPKILAAHGLGERDVRFINLDDANILAALITGDVDAAFGTPQLLDLEQKGAVRVIYTTRNDSPAFTSNSAFFVADAFERRNPEITYRVVKALVKAAAWASDEANREAVFETWALSGVPAAIYRAEFKGQAVRYRNSPLIDGFLVNFYKEQVVASKQLGYIRHDVDVDRWIEPKYLQRALAELKLENYWDAYDADGTVSKIRPPAAP
jgi:sulfonate transport system substrate-binding protein